MVGLLVGAGLLFVIVQALVQRDDEDQAATARGTTSPTIGVESDSQLDAVCAQHRTTVTPLVGAVRDSVVAAQQATTSEAVVAQVGPATQATGQLVASLQAMQRDVQAAPVPAAEAASRDEVARLLGELGFAIGTFASEAIPVLQTGDLAQLDAYEPRATESLVATGNLFQELIDVSAVAGTPSCALA